MNKTILSTGISKNSIYENANRERNYGIDLLRIFAMFMICIVHIIRHGGINTSVKIGSVNSAVVCLIDIVAMCSVNCYALISGYVGVESKYKPSSIIYLCLQAVFYCVIITAIFKITGKAEIGKKDILFTFFPIFSKQYWYLTAYFGLFLFKPILDFALNKFWKELTPIFFSILTIFSVYTILSDDIFCFKFGYCSFWLIVLYLVGGYLKKSNLFSKIKSKYIVLVTFAITLIGCITRFSVAYITDINTKDGMMIYYLNCYLKQTRNYLFPTYIVLSLCFLVLFSRIRFRKKPKVIPFFAATSFGVYLIHDNLLIRENVISNLFYKYAEYNPFMLIIAIFSTAAVIYLTCSIIDYLRIKIFNIIKVKRLISKIDVFFDKKISL